MKKDFSLTFIQVVCAISVVTLHTNGCFWTFSATERYWITANIIESVLYFAVPLFFMITGITLIDYQERYSTSVYFRKRIEKTVIPYIGWSIIGVAFRLALGKMPNETIDAKWIINGILSTDKIISTYWFFLPLFCAYLSIPLFAAIDKEKRKTVSEYVIFAGFVINILLPFINNTFQLGLSLPYSITVVSGYLFWIWMGYRLYYYPLSSKQKTVICVFSLIGLLLHLIGTDILSRAAGTVQTTFKGYTNLPCVLYAPGVFILLRDIAPKIIKSRRVEQLILHLGKYTFPLYLIHWFIIQITETILRPNTTSIWYRLLVPYVIYFCVICLTWILRKIPVIRKIVP